MRNRLERILGKIRIPVIAAFSMPLLFYGHSLAAAQINYPFSFDVVGEYCKQLKDPRHSVPISEIISRSDLPDSEKMVLMLIHNQSTEEQLYFECIKLDVGKRTNK